MKFILTAVFALILPVALRAQPDNDSLALVKRLNIYMDHSRNMEIGKTMDYIHPSLFKIVPRDQMEKAMKESYDPDDIAIGFDSMYVSAITPDFLHNNSRYRRVEYYAVMTMRIKDEESAADTSLQTIMLEGLKEQFPDKQVIFQTEKKQFVIKGSDLLVAIKDEGADWMFLGVEKENPFFSDLFPAKVAEHFKLL